MLGTIIGILTAVAAGVLLGAIDDEPKEKENVFERQN